MLKLYLIRHGETIWNKECKTQGCRNIQLSKMGVLQGKQIAEKLKRRNDSFKRIFTSDLDRCYLTASFIAQELNIDIEVNSNLREMSFGEWEGLTIEEIKELYNEEYRSWRSQPYKSSIPNGEDLRGVQKRCLEAVDKIMERYDNCSIVIVSHSVAIKTMILGLLGIDLKHFYSITLKNASMNIFEFRDYGPVLVSLNDVCHLEEALG
ncbi:histidine phosphatase family protein [Wukongibacter baidiensis]|uniref:histidine phosphatase family protein n=1 Tax=Wukongibacter baidiensis TaxID=1723361 RepID=UPI003D7F2276